MAASNNAGNRSPAAEDQEQEKKQNYFQKLYRYRKYLVIEPFIFFYVMPSVFHSVAMQNFPLEKSCRVNYGYNEAVCQTILDKGDIDCDEFSFGNTTDGPTLDMMAISATSVDFNYTVCKAEVDAQKLAAIVSGRRAPIAAIFPLIVLLFAGGWSDRYNKRKLCMIMPIVGEALSFTCFLISAVFFDELPMEFAAYLEAIVPALFGGITLCLMAIYSYMTIATPAEDRVFRFGIFAMFISAIPFTGQGISGWLFNQLGYVWSFIFAVVFEVIAILYIIFFIDEVKPATSSDQPPLPEHAPPALHHSAGQQDVAGADNLAYEGSNLDDSHGHKNVSFEMSPHTEIPPKKHEPPREDIATVKRSFLRDFFDPTLVKDCFQFPLKRRKNRGRLLLILLIMAYFLTLGPVSGENDYWYRYTLKKLNWNGNDFSIYFLVSSALSLVGTFIGTAILSKALKFSDSAIGILSAVAIVISRVLFAFAKDTTSFYVAGSVDMFVSLRVIAIKAIGAAIVDGDELSKMFSIFGISEPIGQFIFPPIFSVVYQRTVETFPGAIFLFGEIFYIPNVIVFVLCYIILKRLKRRAAKNGSATSAVPENATNVNGSAHDNPDCEITSL